MKESYYNAHPSKRVPKSKFKPNREYCRDAVTKYLKNGGEITKILVLPENEVVAHPHDCLLDE